MNSTRRKLVLFWSIQVTWLLLAIWQRFILAWCILLPVASLVRLSLPQPILPNRLKVWLLCGLIAFFGMIVINEYHALPPILLAANQALAGLAGVFALLWLLRFDCRLFQAQVAQAQPEQTKG